MPTRQNQNRNINTEDEGIVLSESFGGCNWDVRFRRSMHLGQNFLRKSFGNSSGLENWNWRCHTDISLVRSQHLLLRRQRSRPIS